VALTNQFTIRFRYNADGSTFYYGWLIDNVVITKSNNNIVWTPSTALYTNPAATTSYTGTAVSTVYAKPTSTITYTATATSAAGCATTGTVQVVVNQPSVAPTAISGVTTICNGSSTTLTANGTLGTGANYQWGTGSTVGSNILTAETNSILTVSPTATTIYWVRIVNGTSPCASNTSGITTTVTVNDPSVAPTSIDGNLTICNGGYTILTASGGTLGTGATYEWGTGSVVGTNAIANQSGSTLSVSPTSTTTYWVRMINGTAPCSSTTSGITQTVVVNALPTATAVVSTPVACNGGSAVVTVSANGGVSPYSGTGNFTVNAGTFNYSVVDLNGCSASTSITVAQPSVLTASSTSTSILCNGGTATVTVTGNGGTAPYSGTGTYTVSAGTYSYTVTDANGCTATTTITVTEPTALSASSVTGSAIVCNGGATTVIVSGTGGTGPYTGTGTFTVLAGTHDYTVTDANGCAATTNVIVTEPTAISVSYTSTAISCAGGSSVVTISASGGTGTLTGTGAFVVSAGTYIYTVTDANGCSESVSVVVTEPSVLSATAIATAISCYGGTSIITVSATGGTMPYSATGTYTVSSGSHSYTVTDANGCVSNTSVNVTQPALVNAPIGAATQLFCSTLNATLASIQVTGSSIQWYSSSTGGTPLANNTPLVTGTTYYATQTISGCESPSYLAVTVNITVASTYYADADNDGFGNSAITQLACTQPSGYVLNSTDCNDAVATTYPGAPELCNSVDDNCSGFADEGCPSTIAGEEPFNAIEAPSAMYSYCSSFYGTLAGAFPSTLAQSTCITGEDRWYNFTTLSTGVTIFIGSNANDIVIELQDANGNVIDVENSVSGIGTEVLTKTGLTLGATYRVGIRNYNSNAQAGGQFSGCIRHLRAGGADSGTSATWPSTISMCNVFKAAYCGGTGVQYRYTWTGLSGIANGQVYTKTQTSDYLTLTSVTPMLPAGCTYNVLVTAIYTIPNGAGTNEVFEMPALSPTLITISANPLTSLRTSDQCAGGPRYRGSVVASLPWVCGVTNWRWRFTEVNPLNLQTVGLPIEQNRGAASNYITLSSVTALQYGKTYAVQTAPVYSYTGTNYQWGPVTYMCIIGSAGMVIDGSQDATASQDSEKDVSQGASQDLPQDLASHLSQNLELSVYPNPSNGEGVTMTLSGLISDNVQVKVYDALGRKIQSERYVVDGTLQTELNFQQELSDGLYLIEVSSDSTVKTSRILIKR
jgi:hypothetical protein